MTHKLIFAGFGGQGILFSGKVLAYSAMKADMEVSWLPSYGPEMRGGTANCHVIVSDLPISSPLVTEPTILAVMNRPSFFKFEDTLAPGGVIIKDSTLIDAKGKRDDVRYFDIPATDMAMEMNITKLANMIVLGKIVKETGILPIETVISGLEQMTPKRKEHLLQPNKNAIMAGYNY